MKGLQKVTQKLKLSINISKSEISLLTINNHLRHWTLPNISLNNSKLQYSDSPRYLGVTLDPALTLKKHIDTMINKAKNRLKILKKISGLNWSANANILRTMYLALVRPISEYATPAWINANETNLSRIDNPSKHPNLSQTQNFLSPHTELTTNSSVSPHLPANPHKHETQPELFKALGLQIIEENSSLFDITIYTDNSGKNLPFSPSVYKSELSAIDTALKDININSPSKIIIYSDSRAAIYTLQSCFSIQEPLLKSIAKSVNRLPANSTVTVQWLPVHVAIPGNELADSLEKAEALGLPEARESTTQLDEKYFLCTIKTQCLQEWKSNAAHDWYRTGGTSTGSVLPREQQSLISRLKSGHLWTMTFQNGCKVFPLCIKCNSQPATLKHIIDCIDSSIH
ncbi:hypothetical protein LAZ67_20000738 [Cordylochernes scorpioides]|uniref:RNase H type-1 domain-containing protein n=1 Tax=Cordylochernes scorpioides TaxID=51811 RepID=A0ABY6LKD1_9ARAC|nr:hypothetical protein LAZ67_20000738 [Cordylochernes scorpioides]